MFEPCCWIILPKIISKEYFNSEGKTGGKTKLVVFRILQTLSWRNPIILNTRKSVLLLCNENKNLISDNSMCYFHLTYSGNFFAFELLTQGWKINSLRVTNSLVHIFIFSLSSYEREVDKWKLFLNYCSFKTTWTASFCYVFCI